GTPLFKAERIAPAANPYAVYYNGVLYNPATKGCPQAARDALNRLMALSYWRAVNGPEFAKAKAPAKN
ncbi:MAG: hypothetical protein J6P03_07640, partial [Opitutales bacterium]|nr:hypothetical protein [Opitutales bacterium]